MSIKRKIHSFLFAEGRSQILAPFKWAYLRLAWIKAFIKFHEPFLPKKMGELNPDKTIYVIRYPENSTSGYLYIYLSNLAKFIVAEKRGYVPVVDLVGRTLWEDGEPVFGTRDPWEYYFEQPAGIGIVEAMDSRRIVMARDEWPSLYAGGFCYRYEFITGADGRIDRFIAAAAKYARLNERTRTRIDRDWEELTSRGSGKIVAVMSRGTDYNRTKPADHPIQPSPERLIAEARSIIESGKASRVFLKTEERSVREMFEREFGDALLTFDQSYFDGYHDEPTDESGSIKDNVGEYIARSAMKSKYEMNYEYLRGVVCASRCSYLVCGINGGTISAVIMNGGKYEEVRAICEGYFPAE